MAEFNIKDLIGKAHFDYVGPAFPLWWKTNKTKMILPDLMGISEAILKGKPYFTTLKLRYKGEEFVLPNEPLIALSLSKTIKETPTVGKFRKGTVKEYITTEDYQINLRGVCVDLEDTDRYPAEQVDEINKLFEIKELTDIQVDQILGCSYEILKEQIELKNKENSKIYNSKSQKAINRNVSDGNLEYVKNIMFELSPKKSNKPEIRLDEEFQSMIENKDEEINEVTSKVFDDNYELGYSYYFNEKNSVIRESLNYNMK